MSCFSLFLLFPTVNLVKPSAKYACRLRFWSTLVAHTLYFSQWTAIIFFYSTNWLVLAMEMNWVLCEVGTEFLNSFHMKFMLKRVNCCVGWVAVDIGGLLLCPLTMHPCEQVNVSCGLRNWLKCYDRWYMCGAMQSWGWAENILFRWEQERGRPLKQRHLRQDGDVEE